jgi:site-specific DNA-methyltransferase (adenine-specific)
MLFPISHSSLKKKAPRNRTLELSSSERDEFRRNLYFIDKELPDYREILNRTILGDTLDVLKFLPAQFVDLIFVDPPYNLSKKYNGNQFLKKRDEDYLAWLDLWFRDLHRIIKANGSVYVCCDWQTSPLIYLVGKRYFIPRNRITWEREKGRGAKANWKNCSEDIWFFTASEDYTFNIERVKIQRKVIAPYVDHERKPKDWLKGPNGNYRITHPSNFWNDLTIPFWSMPENTNHPTQKPEKLLAKIILASSNPGDIVLDPFLGSGTTSVVARKLDRAYLGIEAEEEYCLLTEKRLALAREYKSIQGFHNGIFWERNSVPKNL